MTDSNVTTLLPRKPATKAERQTKRRQKAAAKAAARAKRYRARKRDATKAENATPQLAGVTVEQHQGVTATAVPTVARRRDGCVTVAAFAAAVALASFETFSGTVGMTAIFPASPIPVMVLTGILEAVKLVAAAWLARHWRVAPLALRAPLTGIVVALMVLTGIGAYGYFTRAHLAHQVEARGAIDNEASPVAEKIKIAESDLHDLDDRIRQFDGMVSDATSRGRTRTAMALVDDQAKKRSDLVTERRTVATKLADLRGQVSAVEARRAQLVAENGPARYLAELLGWGDGEAAVKLITLLLVLVIDPAAILLMLAATRGAS